MARSKSLSFCSGVISGCSLLLTASACSNPPAAVTEAPVVKSEEQAEENIAPPIAEKRSFVVKSPNGDREDEYYWMRDDTRKDPAVLSYLEAENHYRDEMLAPLEGTKKKLFDEIVGRMKQDDASVPYSDRGHHYYTRYEEGKEYPIHARKKGSLDAKEEVLLDVNAMSKGHEFYGVGRRSISPSGDLLAFGEDTVGRRQYTIRVKDLKSGKILEDELVNTTGNVAWAADNRTIFYVEKDPVTLLGVRVKRHVLGQKASEDEVVYEEPDHTYYMYISETSDHRYILIHLSSTVSSEIRYLPANKAKGDFKVFAARERDFEYGVDHMKGRWVVRTNWQAKNFRLMEVADRKAGDRKRWKELIPGSDSVYIGDFSLFDDYLVIGERSEGLQRIRIRNWKDGNEKFIETDEAAYSAWIDVNAEQDTNWLRYSYTSLRTPSTVYELDMKTGERKMLKRDEVLGGFDRENYVTERQWATARDGTKVPVSLVYRKGFKKDGTAPLYQYAYGSYGMSMDPGFRSGILSLLDRGFVYALAHIRGGQEMGRQWYEDGKLLKKKNTFTDFIDVTKFLVAEKYAAPGKAVASGGSAGGLLVGAVANMAPELYRTIVAHVPFVDVVTTMLDESIPLTTNEFDEWGNPKEKAYYDYMLSYSPYDNVAAKDYPSMIVFTGLWDSQVQYFEPAKWVARLRAKKTDHNPLVFSVNMDAGHGGASGRFRRQEDRAVEYAFILQEFGMLEEKGD